MKSRIEVTKIFTFDSAHLLNGYDGDCSRLHGHTYKLEVTATKDPLVDAMVIDFKILNQIVKEEVISKLDHYNLNDVLPFRTTAENTAIWILEALTRRMFGYSREMGYMDAFAIRITKVRLWETPTSFSDAINKEGGI